METQKIRIALMGLIVFVSLQSPAQKIWEERRGCIMGQGNLAPAYLFAQKGVTGYVDGDIEIYLADRISLIGSAWASFATTHQDQMGIKANHAIFWGMNYHFLKPSRWDPYVGFTPGIGLSRASYRSGEEIRYSPYTLVPLVGLSVGCNYYVGSIFHFFVKVQGVAGELISTLPAPIRLDEIKFMAGLGFNLRAWKTKKHDTWSRSAN